MSGKRYMTVEQIMDLHARRVAWLKDQIVRADAALPKRLQKAAEYAARGNEENQERKRSREAAERGEAMWLEYRSTGQSLRSLGRKHGISPERTRQIIAKAERIIKYRIWREGKDSLNID